MWSSLLVDGDDGGGQCCARQKCKMPCWMKVAILTFGCHMYIMNTISRVYCNHYKQICLYSVCSGYIGGIMYMW